MDFKVLGVYRSILMKKWIYHVKISKMLNFNPKKSTVKILKAIFYNLEEKFEDNYVVYII